MKGDLPRGWSECRAGEILSFNYGKGLPARERRPGQVGVYGSAGLVGSHDTPLTDVPVVVIGRKGAAGRITVADGPAWTIDTAYYVVPPAEFDIRFLAYQLTAAELSGLDQSTAVPSLSRDDLNGLRVRVAPLSQQQQTVEALERQLQAVESADGDLEASSERLEALRLSSLQQLFRLDSPEVKLGDIADVFVGATPPRKDPANWGGDIPWVSSGEVAFCRIRDTRETITEAGLGNRDRRLHPRGTVLLAMIGEGRTRGQAAILDVPAAHNQNSAAIRLHPDAMLPEFLYYCLMARYEANRRRGAGSQQPALNGKLVKSLTVPCPPVERQRQLVSRIEAAFAEIAEIDALTARQRTLAVALRRSLLHHAFSGQFVTDDQSETAEGLIDRMRAQHRPEGRRRSEGGAVRKASRG